MLRILSRSFPSLRSAVAINRLPRPLTRYQNFAISHPVYNIQRFAVKPPVQAGLQDSHTSIRRQITSEPQTCASSIPPPPPPPSRPSTSATVMVYSLLESQITISPAGYAAIGHILQDLPFSKIDTQWVGDVANTFRRYIQTSSRFSSVRSLQAAAAAGAAISIEDSKVQRQIDRLNERMLMNPEWGHIYYETMLTDEGIKEGGDEEIRRVMEILLNCGWVEPLEDQPSFYEMIAQAWAP